MASPQLAIAKVSFSAVLLRQDPTSCPRNEIEEFLGLLNATLARCSPANVQKSKQWILKNLVQSPLRVPALGKYLTALVNTFSTDIAASRKAREPSAKRKRLHVLYLLNDVLYHVSVRNRDSSFASQLEQFLPGLVQSAARFSNCPKHMKKVLGLVTLWDEQDYFSPVFINKLEGAISEAPNSESASNKASSEGATGSGTKSSKDAPFIMPAMHGDANSPWYDLPAANWLPAIEPNSTRPMNPSMIKPLQFMPGPADTNLVKAVQDLLSSVDKIYAKDHCLGEDPTVDIDPLGQRIVLDEITGDIVDGETYYGWSRNFCKKMKHRRNRANESADRRGRSLSRSRSRSSSRSSSRPAFKRRRMSDSRSRSRSRSRSGLRSPSREGRRRSYSRSRSPSPARGRRFRSCSPSGNRSPLPPPPPKGYSNPHNNGFGNSFGNQLNYPIPNPPYPSVPLPNLPFGVPPPPPPLTYQGSWPPPPPPPIPNTTPWMMPVTQITGWGSPAASIPPPPPQPYSSNSRGDFQGRRGGWRGGRGGWQ